METFILNDTCTKEVTYFCFKEALSNSHFFIQTIYFFYLKKRTEHEKMDL